MRICLLEIRGIIRKIILRILNEADIYRDHNFWVDPSGKVNGPFDHGHVGYILKVAIPQKKVSLTPPEISFIEKERGSEDAWEPMFQRGWIRLRKRKDYTEIDANYDKNKVSPRAKKSLIDWIFKNMAKSTKIIYINHEPYDKEEFFQNFEE